VIYASELADRRFSVFPKGEGRFVSFFFNLQQKKKLDAEMTLLKLHPVNTNKLHKKRSQLLPFSIEFAAQ